MNPDNKDQSVVSSKTKLMNALGSDSSQKYFFNMKLWFRQKLSKEEFDMECRKLLNHEQMHLHNKFLIALLNKLDAIAPPNSTFHQNVYSDMNSCHSMNSSGSGGQTNSNISAASSSKKRRKSSRSDWPKYENDEDRVERTYNPNVNHTTLRYAAQEMFLPDAGLIMGRLLVGAWENGLSTVDDMAVEIIVQAVQTLLKNILTAIINRKKGSRSTDSGQFLYDFGYEIKNPYLRNTASKQKVDDEQIDISKVITSANTTPRVFDENIFTTNCEKTTSPSKRHITLLDLYKTLQDKNVLPSHSVYTLNIERISNML